MFFEFLPLSLLLSYGAINRIGCKGLKRTRFRNARGLPQGIKHVPRVFAVYCCLHIFGLPIPRSAVAHGLELRAHCVLDYQPFVIEATLGADYPESSHAKLR